ncbi:MAG: exodeoxyribonuclease VII large subunit [Ignavibacteria bacterium]|nr:exodeoxyribonuclease VII large subunit [Ignavibacteria bacterium]
MTYHIRTLLEDGIGNVFVTGELSNYKQHSSGHRYFTLKDSDAQISCVMWRSRTLGFQPEDGMKVLITGKLTVYPQHGKYQIDCTSLRPHGVGDLHAAFEALKKKLSALGWFDTDRKRSLPDFPRSVGIATSATGAALHDMISTIGRRFPAVQVVFRPTVVQGNNASADIVQAIKDLERQQVDVIIIGRGGGSLEDLWCFNEENVARAVFESSIPIISAVGHETDFTISDFVADYRAATPTAAAEAVTPYTVREIASVLRGYQDSFTTSITLSVEALQDTVEMFLDGRALRRIIERLNNRVQRVDELEEKIGAGLRKQIQKRLNILESFSQTSLLHIRHSIQRTASKVEHLTALLQSHHPLTPLRKGFAIISSNGVVYGAKTNLVPGTEVTIMRQHETADATIHTVNKTETISE